MAYYGPENGDIGFNADDLGVFEGPGGFSDTVGPSGCCDDEFREQAVIVCRYDGGLRGEEVGVYTNAVPRGKREGGNFTDGQSPVAVDVLGSDAELD